MEPKLTGYVGTSLLLLGNASHDIVGGACINAGGKLENNGYYVQAEGGYGTAAYVKAEAGKNISFGNSNFGVSTSVSGQYAVENRTSDYYQTKYTDSPDSPTWKANDMRGYVQSSLTYHNSVVEFGLGVRGGVRTSTQASIDGFTSGGHGVTSGTEYAGRTTEFLAEPFVNFGAKLGKNWKLALQAAPSQGMLGVSYNF